jgi:hypothetical protein
MGGTSERQAADGGSGGDLCQTAVKQNELQCGRHDPHQRMMGRLLPRVGRSRLALRFYKLGIAKDLPRRSKNFVFARQNRAPFLNLKFATI